MALDEYPENRKLVNQKDNTQFTSLHRLFI